MIVVESSHKNCIRMFFCCNRLPRVGADGAPAADHAGYDSAKSPPSCQLILLYLWWLISSLPPFSPNAVSCVFTIFSYKSSGQEIMSIFPQAGLKPTRALASEPQLHGQSHSTASFCTSCKQAFSLSGKKSGNTDDDNIPLPPHAGLPPFSHC